MEESTFEPVRLERIRKDATCIITRLGLGEYELRGPRENVLVPESRVAYSTVINDLIGEGYRLVSPGEYAEATGLDSSVVDAGINQEGTLFAVQYGDETAVALPRKEALLPEIEA